MTADTLTAIPLPDAPLGATIQLPSGITDPADLNDADFQKLKEALMTYSVVVIPDQAKLKPSSQYAITKRMDPSCGEGAYGHSKEFRHKQSVLAKDGSSVPHQPQVQILGQGTHHNHEGVEEVTLTHPVHDTFHKNVLTDEEKAQGYTRFYRWHIDSALYGLSPPVCTTLLGIDVPPSTKTQKVKYTDTGDELELTQAATCFVSGANAFKLLSPEDQKLALESTVVYAPHPYIFISPAKATDDGLTMVSEGKEMALDKLPEWEESKVKRLPMVWTNPVTGEHHLQAHGCCVHKIERKNGEVLELEAARKELYRIMRPNIDPKYVYAHSWKAGDLVLFHNQGVWHSVTGQFAPGEKRLMHQCNIASGVDPVCKA
ncbi:putative dioxygenase [Yarrowia sp. B02]|nr:putative dioxygenase [Yarrowia sp. B02]